MVMVANAEKTDRIYYSMGQVAEILDVEPSLVRFWEQKFDIIKPKRNKKGNRMFTPGDLDNLKTIYHLVKERGMTLSGAQKHMKANRGSIGRDMELAERLNSIRSLLMEVRQALGGGGTVVDDLPGIHEIAPMEISEDIPAIKALETALGDAATEIIAHTKMPEPSPVPEPEPASVPESEPKDEIAGIIEQAHEEEVIDTLMDDVIEALNNEPEEMLDFDPDPDPVDDEPAEEPKPAEPQKPVYIEQTLF